MVRSLVGAEEFVHAVFSFDRLWANALPSVRLGISTTWLTGRAMLVGALFFACLVGDRVVPPEKCARDALRFNLTGFLLSAIIACAIFNVPHLSGIVRLGTWSKELLELTLAALLFTAFLIYYRRYQQLPHGSPLLLSLLCCLACQVVIHLFVFDAQYFYDAHWDAAHVFKLLGYFFPIFGVWGETINIHQIARSQYVELTKEMAVRKQSEQALALYRSHLEDLVQERTGALDFEGRQHGCIRIAARLEEQSTPRQRIVLLSVADDGHGVPPEHIDQLFDPFFTTKFGQGGSGIGLNITHRIVTRLLGGTIHVASPPRAGTTFTLRIPQQSPLLI